MTDKSEMRDILFRTEMARKRRLIPVWTEMGLISGQPRVLSELYYHENISQKELADLCCIEPATLSRALDRLEFMGYLVRNDNPDCRRSFLIALTEEGRKRAGDVWEEFHTLEDKMFAGFSEEELDRLHAYLYKLYDNLQ